MRRQYDFTLKVTEPRQAKIRRARQIIDEYLEQGLTLTLRQLYYQHVARDLVPNTHQEYKKLGNLITDARMAGLIDWTTIEDRTRFLRGNSHWNHPADIIDASARQFRFDLWADQPERVEVWIEKDALVGVIEGICRTLDVDYFACRGHVSASEMWVAGQRIGRYLDAGQKVTILHLGDHDPSGMQMTDDIQNRLTKFTTGDLVHEAFDAFEEEEDPSLEVRRFVDERNRDHLAAPSVDRIALNMDQVRQYRPPPNPTKMSDSRAKGYVERFGRESWELDALNPTTLRDLIQVNVEAHRDQATWDASVARQSEARRRLTDAAGQIRAEMEHEAEMEED